MTFLRLKINSFVTSIHIFWVLESVRSTVFWALSVSKTVCKENKNRPNLPRNLCFNVFRTVISSFKVMLDLEFLHSFSVNILSLYKLTNLNYPLGFVGSINIAILKPNKSDFITTKLHKFFSTSLRHLLFIFPR